MRGARSFWKKHEFLKIMWKQVPLPYSRQVSPSLYTNSEQDISSQPSPTYFVTIYFVPVLSSKPKFYNRSIYKPLCAFLPIPVAARSKAWVCDRSLSGIGSSNPAGGTDVCLL